MFSESRCKVNYIHGRLNDKDNPVIFGYGDESDSYYEKMEKLNEDEFLKHLKSNNYHRTSNYRNLFKFLGSDKFNVYVMGHSCGLSDKVLLSSIFEHQNLNEIKLFYYQKDENNNDYLEKTQQLARHIKLESRKKFKEKKKHKEKRKFQVIIQFLQFYMIMRNLLCIILKIKLSFQSLIILKPLKVKTIVSF